MVGPVVTPSVCVADAYDGRWRPLAMFRHAQRR